MADQPIGLNPIIVPVRPLVAGKDISQPPQDISPNGASNLMNVRFHYGQLMMRNGFSVQYQGADEPAMGIIRVEDATGAMTAMTMIGSDNVWQTAAATSLFEKMKLVKVGTISGICDVANQYISHVTDADIDKIYPGTTVAEATEGTLVSGQTVDYVVKGADGADQGRVYLSAVPDATHGDEVTITISEKVTLTADWTSDYVSYTHGIGTYTPWNLNGVAIYPTTGYADIAVWTNGVDGVFAMIPSSDGDPLACELIEDDSSVGLAGARCVAIFEGHLIVGGTTNSGAQLVWSVADAYDTFTGTGSGWVLLGDDEGLIQNMLQLGNYLVIYEDTSIWLARKSGSTTSPFMFDKAVSQTVGLAAPKSVVQVKDYHIFLGWDNVYKFSQAGLEPIGDPIKDELLGRTGGRGIEPQYINRCFGVHVEAFNEYWLFIPSGRYPSATNVYSDPIGKTLATTGTFTIGQVTVVLPAAALKYVIPGYSALYGGSTWVTVTHVDTATNTVYHDIVATASGTLADYRLSKTAQWTIGSSSAASTKTTIAGGPFTGYFQRVTKTGATPINFITGLYITMATGGAGRTISAVCWMRADTETTIAITLFEWDLGHDTAEGAYVENEFNVVVAASTVFQPYIISITTTLADFADLQMKFTGPLSTSVLDISAVHVCDITDLDQVNIYKDPLTGYLAPGFTDLTNTVQLIPHIVDEVGPWLCDTVWVYNYLYKSWTCWEVPATAHAFDALASTKTLSTMSGTVGEQTWRFDDKLLEKIQETTLLGMIDGQLYEIGPRFSLDWEGDFGQAITSFWESKDFDMGAPYMDKSYMRLALFHEISHPPTVVTIGISTDSGVTWYDQEITMRTGYSETFCDFITTGRQARFRLTADTPGFNITGMSIKVAPRGEAYAY